MSSQIKKSKANPGPDAVLESLEIGSALYQTRLTSKYRNRKKWQKPDEKRVVSVIPGTIQKIMVGEGEMVETGTPLLILEAMKMRNELKALMPGTIKKIHIREGEQVPKFHLLLEFS
jgi:biotin carboxyl carrier protein